VQKISLYLNLYIPHGSDERKSKRSSYDLFVLLYIPHGSDERSACDATQNRFHKVYIPHGSDESDAKLSVELSTDTFISHMVQMKEEFSLFVSGYHNQVYIPHGSDESLILFKRVLRGFSVYIPHGSDERPLDELDSIASE